MTIKKKKNLHHQLNVTVNQWGEKMKKTVVEPFRLWVKAARGEFKAYFKRNGTVILVLALIVIAAYGFDLFNLNLTIDEEIHSFYYPPETWIRQGRWGIFLLRKLFLPYTTVPVIPLLLGLGLHLLGMLILIEAWEVKRGWQKVMIGAIGIICPVTATMYTFSIMNFAIGAGYFLVALSVLAYSRMQKGWKYLAIFPGILAIAMYQAFLPTLLTAYLAYLLTRGLEKNPKLLKGIAESAMITIGSLLGYWGIQKLLELYDESFISAYITNQLSLPASWQEILDLGRIFLQQMFRLYSGHESLYIEKVYVLGVLMFIIGIAYIVRLFNLKAKLGVKILSLLIFTGIVITPFISGFFMKGVYSPRFLLSYPMALAALFMEGVTFKNRFMQGLLGICAVLTIFSFTLTDNRLVASSHLTLQKDRLVASNLNIRIADAASEAGVRVADLKYMEIVGYLSYPEADLFPKVDTFG
ncbi:MAG: glucosyltransferase domain-containing protein, partial [Anaerolineaceae bacterium]|nr:glucosyltransferase domain-containing protein [Anaerolineaceae bacterium]